MIVDLKNFIDDKVATRVKIQHIKTYPGIIYHEGNFYYRTEAGGQFHYLKAIPAVTVP